MDGVTPKFVLPETFDGVKMEITGQLGMIWELVKAPVIVPLLQLAVYICLLMSLMLLCERVYMGIVIVLVKLFWKKPHKRYKFEPIQDDEELGSSNFPVVLVQIPMFNEREVSFISLCFFPLFQTFSLFSHLCDFDILSRLSRLNYASDLSDHHRSTFTLIVLSRQSEFKIKKKKQNQEGENCEEREKSHEFVWKPDLFIIDIEPLYDLSSYLHP